MLRSPRPLLVLAAGCAAVPVALVAPASAAGPPAGASITAKRTSCTTSVTDPQDRSVGFVVRQRDGRPRSSSWGYGARLQTQVAGGRWRTLPVADSPTGLDGSTVRARAGARVLVCRIAVNGIIPGTRYRLAVRAAWRGTRTRSRTVHSATCLVRDLRPDVVLGSGPVLWTPAPTADQVVYDVPVHVDGASALPTPRTVAVEVRQSGAVLARGTFSTDQPLDALAVTGRRCRASAPITVVADADGTVDERDETNDVVVSPCRAAMP